MPKSDKFLRSPEARGETGSGIKRFKWGTRHGNILEFSYNPALGLVIVDLVHKSGSGSNEIFRKMLDETRMLGHVNDPFEYPVVDSEATLSAMRGKKGKEKR